MTYFGAPQTPNFINYKQIYLTQISKTVSLYLERINVPKMHKKTAVKKTTVF